MPLQHVVKRGDSLWGLAGRHLGNYARWPELVAYHNGEVRKSGGNRGRVFSIKDPNAIFVGQILYLPIRDRRMLSTVKKTGTKQEASKNAIPIDLNIEYAFGNDERGFSYFQDAPEYLIKTVMKGKIAIEIISTDRHRHNLELLMSKDAMQCKTKLNAIYQPVFSALTAKPDVEFTGGKVVLKTPVSANAGIQLYTIHLDHNLTGRLSPQMVSGNVGMNGRTYKFSAKFEFRVYMLKKQSLTSNLKNQLVDGLNNVYDTFADKDNRKEIGKGFEAAGKIVALSLAGSALKAYAILDVATGGPVTTTATLVAGSPVGQKIIIEFIPSMNPGTLPSLNSLYGVLGWATGTTIETIATRK
jgi:hypothetical protein